MPHVRQGLQQVAVGGAADAEGEEVGPPEPFLDQVHGLLFSTVTRPSVALSPRWERARVVDRGKGLLQRGHQLGATAAGLLIDEADGQLRIASDETGTISRWNLAKPRRRAAR